MDLRAARLRTYEVLARAEARAASRVRLLALDARELDRLLNSRPELAEQLKTLAANLPV
jgi:hypothetical protein